MTTLPVREHYLRFDRVVDEEKAKDAWRAYVEAHGWTVVGEGAGVRKMPDGDGWVAVGRLIQTEQTLNVVIAGDVSVINLP